MTMQNVTPVTGFVTTRARLNARSGAPSVSAPIAMRLEIGSQLPVRGITTGDAVNGNPQWYVGLNDTFFWAGACGPLIAGAATPSPKSTTTLSGRVESAPPGVLGFDLDQPVTAQSAQTFYARGFRFCVRYLTRSSDEENSGDLTRSEAEIILNAGFALMAIQHVAPKNWLPSGGLGEVYGGNAVKNAQQVGLPPGVNVWLDLEGIRGDTPRQDVIDYCNAWFASVGAAGYSTGIYVGDSVIISPDDLYWNLKTKHYWKSGSNVPDVPNRGYQLIQRIPPNADDQKNVDTDLTRNDSFGDTVQWLTRA
jgi:Domain of unknown function (DUF1906)